MVLDGPQGLLLEQKAVEYSVYGRIPQDVCYRRKDEANHVKYPVL